MATISDNLTEKELSILQHLADGKRPDDMQSRLHLKRNTIREYLRTIREKLDAPTTTNAACTAIRRGLID